MTQKEIRQRIQELTESELRLPEKWFYLSFADENRFLGGLFLRAYGVTTATRLSHLIGCNPGGEVLCLESSDGFMATVPESMRNRLLTRDEVLLLQNGAARVN